MSYQDILEELNKFRNAYFFDHKESEEGYQPSSHNSRPSSQPIIISNPYPYPSQPATTIINNVGTTQSDKDEKEKKKKKDEEKDEEEKKKKKDEPLSNGQLILYAVPVVIGTGAAIYTAAQDSYIKLIRSNIQSLVQSSDDIELKVRFNEWLDIYKERTGNSFMAKLTGFLSTFAIGCGVYQGSNSIKVGSFLALLLSSGYLFWKYLTNDLTKEKKKFNLLLEYVQNHIYRSAN